MVRKFGPFDTSVFYEVENRRLQRAFNPRTGFVKTGQGAVTAGTGAQLVIAAYPDGALIDGLYVENPASETVTLTTNTASTNPRIDRLVLRLDMDAKTIAPFQIVGTPAASPSAPSLTNTATVVDMPLCQYRFPGSASAQNPDTIIDERQTIAPETSTSAATANTLVRRDSAGRFAAGAPSATGDVATKGYADGLGTSANTANTIVRRDGNGRFTAVSPAGTNDVATKGYVDGRSKAGGGTYTTNASGYATVTHNAGYVPASVQVTGRDATNAGIVYAVIEVTSTQFTLYVSNGVNSPAASYAAPIYWSVFP